MRILMIASSFPPVTGGAETYAFDVARGLGGRGHRVVVATDLPHGHAPGDAFADDPPGVTVRRLSRYRDLLDDPSKLRWEQMAYGCMSELADASDAARPDVIFSNSLDAALLGKTIALEHDLPLVAAFHEHAPEDEPLAAGRLRLVYDVLRPDAVLAGSEFYAARARRWGPQTRLEMIHHGVDTALFHPDRSGSAVRERYGFTDSDVIVVCAGRLKPRKGIHSLIEAFASVHRRRPHTRLLVVGSVSSASLAYAAGLDSQIVEHGLDGVVTIDRQVTFDAMPDVVAAADVVAQPSLEEGLGLSVLEAMAAGRAVITTDVAGIREIVTEPDVAITLPPARPDLLAEALVRLVDDPGRRAELGVGARAHVESHFSQRRMLERTEAVLASVGDHRTKETPVHV